MKPLTSAADTPPDEPARLCPVCYGRVHRYGWSEDRCSSGHVVGIIDVFDASSRQRFSPDYRAIFAEKRAREAEARIADLERALAVAAPPVGDLSSAVDEVRLRLAVLTDARTHEGRMRAVSDIQRHAVNDITALLCVIDDAAGAGAAGLSPAVDCDDCRGAP